MKTRPVVIRLDPAVKSKDGDPTIAIVIDYGYFDQYDKENNAPKFKHESTKAFVQISDGKVFMENGTEFNSIDAFKSAIKKDHLRRMRNHPSHDPDPISPPTIPPEDPPPSPSQRAIRTLALHPDESLFMLVDTFAQDDDSKPQTENRDILWNFVLPFARKGGNPVAILVTCDKSTGEISIRTGRDIPGKTKYEKFKDFSSFLKVLKKDNGTKLFIIPHAQNQPREDQFNRLNDEFKEKLLKKTEWREQDSKELEELLIKGAEIDKEILVEGEKTTPFLYAVSNCKPEVIDLLIEYGALNESNMIEALNLANKRTSPDKEGNRRIFEKIKAFRVSKLPVESVNLGDKDLRSDKYIEIIRDIQAKRKDPWYSQNFKRPYRVFLADESRSTLTQDPEHVTVVVVCANGMGGVSEIKGLLNLLDNSVTTYVSVLDEASGKIIEQADQTFKTFDAFIDFASTNHLAILRADPRHHEASDFAPHEIAFLKRKKLGKNKVMLIDHGKSREHEHHDFAIITTDDKGVAKTEMVEFDPVTGTIKRDSGAVESYKALFDNPEFVNHQPYTIIDRFKEKVDIKVKNLLEAKNRLEKLFSQDQNSFMQLRDDFEELYAFLNAEKTNVSERRSGRVDTEYDKIIEEAKKQLQTLQSYYDKAIEASIQEIQEKHNRFMKLPESELNLEEVKKFYSSLLREARERLYHSAIPTELDERYKSALVSALSAMKRILIGNNVSLPKVPHPKIGGEDVDIETGTLFSQAELDFIKAYIKENQMILKNIKLKRGFSGPNEQGRFDRIQDVPALTLKNGRKLILRYSLNFDEKGNCFAQYTGKGKHLLGKGTYGRVKIGQKLFNEEGVRVENGEKTADGKENTDKGWVAIKVIEDKFGSTDAEFEKERNFWMKELRGVTRLADKEKSYLMTPLYELSLSEYQAPSYLHKIDVAISAARAIERKHKEGILHLDIKGGNMMLNPVTQEVTTIDYGLSIQVKDTTKLSPAIPKGTPPFMALEVTQGLVSAKTDIFAYGAMLILELKLFDQHPVPIDPKILLQSVILASEIIKTNSHERLGTEAIISKLEAMKTPLNQEKLDTLQGDATKALESLLNNITTQKNFQFQEMLVLRIMIGLYASPEPEKSIIFNRKLFRFTKRWDNFIMYLDRLGKGIAQPDWYDELFPNLPREEAMKLSAELKDRIVKEREEVNVDYNNIYAIIPDKQLEPQCDFVYNALHLLNASISNHDLKPFMLYYWRALKEEQNRFSWDFKESYANLEELKKTAATIADPVIQGKYEEVIKEETQRLQGISLKYRATLYSVISAGFRLAIEGKENRNLIIQKLEALAAPFFGTLSKPGSAIHESLEAYLNTLREELIRPSGLDLDRWMNGVMKRIPIEHLGSWFNICNVVAHPELLRDSKGIAAEFPQISTTQPVASPLRVMAPQAPTTRAGQALNWLQKLRGQSPPKEKPKATPVPPPPRNGNVPGSNRLR